MFAIQINFNYFFLIKFSVAIYLNSFLMFYSEFMDCIDSSCKKWGYKNVVETLLNSTPNVNAVDKVGNQIEPGMLSVWLIVVWF